MYQPRPQGLLLLQNGGRRNPGQGCWNTPRIVEYFVTWCVFCNRKPLFRRNKDISSCLRDEILTYFWSHFGSLGQEFLRPPFWTRRRPWGRGRGWPCITFSILIADVQFLKITKSLCSTGHQPLLYFEEWKVDWFQKVWRIIKLQNWWTWSWRWDECQSKLCLHQVRYKKGTIVWLQCLRHSIQQGCTQWRSCYVFY